MNVKMRKPAEAAKKNFDPEALRSNTLRVQKKATPRGSDSAVAWLPGAPTFVHRLSAMKSFAPLLPSWWSSRFP